MSIKTGKLITLNLGCGNNPLGWAINHDRIKHSQWVDVASDLDIYPWSWNSNYADTIYCIDVIEHLQNVVRALEEIHRILVPSGLLHLQVPGAHSQISFRDPTHLHFFTMESFDYFVPGTELEKDYGFYSRMRWKMIERKYVGPSVENISFIMEKI
jgi:SAM-dependent methyltransferase